MLKFSIHICDQKSLLDLKASYNKDILKSYAVIFN